MRTKMTSLNIIIFLTIIISISNVLAITATNANHKMVLRIAPEETVEKYIQLQNTNPIPITIEISVTGDLKDNVKLKDNNFILNSGEEKRVYFTIKADKEGTTETRFNVKFVPEKGTAAAVPTIVTIIADEKYKGTGIIEEKILDKAQPNTKISSTSTNREINKKQNSPNNSNLQITILIISTFALIIILISIYFYSLTKPQKKQAKKYE